MSEIIRIILRSVHSMNGVLLVPEKEIPHDLQDIYDAVYTDLEMKTPEDDKKNMNSDVQNFRLDFKKSVNEAKLAFADE